MKFKRFIPLSPNTSLQVIKLHKYFNYTFQQDLYYNIHTFEKVRSLKKPILHLLPEIYTTLPRKKMRRNLFRHHPPVFEIYNSSLCWFHFFNERTLQGPPRCRKKGPFFMHLSGPDNAPTSQDAEDTFSSGDSQVSGKSSFWCRQSRQKQNFMMAWQI